MEEPKFAGLQPEPKIDGTGEILCWPYVPQLGTNRIGK